MGSQSTTPCDAPRRSVKALLKVEPYFQEPRLRYELGPIGFRMVGLVQKDVSVGLVMVLFLWRGLLLLLLLLLLLPSGIVCMGETGIELLPRTLPAALPAWYLALSTLVIRPDP